MNHDVFISYSSKNSTAAQVICHELEDNGIKCWMAPRDIPVGAKYASIITKAIVASRIVVLVFSDASARSPWVESEINIAFSNRKTIVPYKIDTTNIEDFEEFYLMLNNRHWIEAYPDYKIRFKELVTVVAQTLGITISGKNVYDVVSSTTPIPIPIQKLNNLKKYLWVSVCVLVLVLGVQVWSLKVDGIEVKTEEMPQIVVSQEPTDSVPITDAELEELRTEEKWIEKNNEALLQNNVEMQSQVKNSTQKLNENKSSAFAQNTITASVKKEDPKSKQSTTVQKAETEEMQKDDSYLLNLSDGEFERFYKNDKCGFKLKSTGEIVVPPKYDFAVSFFRGLASVELNGKWGFIDKTGKEVTSVKYDDVESFSEGLASVELNGKWGYVDKTGKEIVRLIYDDTKDFLGGLAAVKSNYKWGFIDKNGTVIIPFKYDDIFSGFIGGCAGCKLNNKWGFVDKTGKEIIPFKYDYILSIESYGGRFNRARVKLNDEWFYVDKNGNRIEE